MWVSPGSGKTLPVGSTVVPSCGLHLGSKKVIPKPNYYGACGYGNLSAAPSYLEDHTGASGIRFGILQLGLYATVSPTSSFVKPYKAQTLSHKCKAP